MGLIVCAQTVVPFRHFYLYTAIKGCICGSIRALVVLSAFGHSAQHQSHHIYRRHLDPGFAFLAT
jgi:hypothetical protein